MKSSYVIRNLKTPLPRLRISGISEEICENDVAAFLTMQNKHIFTSPSECKLLKYSPLKNKSDRFQIIVQVDLKTYSNAGHCLIGLDGCNLYDTLEVLRCYNCNGFNHGKKYYKNNLTCPRCGANHEVSKFQSEKLQCSNCCNIQEKNNVTEDVAHATWDYNKCFFFQTTY